MIGSIAIVIGILSMTDERIAVDHRIIIAVIIIFFSTPPAIISAKYVNTHACSRPPTRINNDAKNRNTESSIFLRYF